MSSRKRLQMLTISLMLSVSTSCGVDSKPQESTGQVVLSQSQEVLQAAALPGQTATLDIVGVRTNIPMTVNPDGSVTATVDGVPVGTWTFRISYRAGGVVIMQASGSQTVVESATVEVSLTQIDANFDDDGDGASNLEEVKVGSDPKDPLSRPVTIETVEAGAFFTCARLSNGKVKCWGQNVRGQLGTGEPSPRETRPQFVSEINSAVQIAVGVSHACALLSDGTVRCWGSNSDGELGNGLSTPNPTPFPVKVQNITTATAIATGAGHTCALLANQTVSCWGRNSEGQLGNGTFSNSPTVFPQNVRNIATAAAIAIGGLHTCALLSDKKVWCWGWNNHHQLGAPSQGTNNSNLPILVADFNNYITNAAGLSLGHQHTCVLADNRAFCWGRNDYGQAGADPRFIPEVSFPQFAVSGLNDVLQVDAGVSYHTCARLGNGTLRCWGQNHAGQLGNNNMTTDPTFTPQIVSGITTSNQARSVTAGYDHTCARLVSGKVSCFGGNNSGQLGDGGTTISPVPVEVVDLP